MSEMPSLDEAVEFAENPEPRCPCVLLLDTSSSMQGLPIDALNQGLRTFKDELMKDPLASRRVEVAVVTFDSEVRVIQDFVTADQFQPPPLTAQGLTYMGHGVHKALDMIQARKARYRLKDDEAHKRVAFFAVGVEGADMIRLSQIAVRTPVKLLGLNFVEMFAWLSRSTQAVAHAGVDGEVALPPPGWGAV